MISVIVPVYNVEPFLERCLDSIIDQTYRDLEILIIDDGSTDKSGYICDRYAAGDSRIHVYHTQNCGLSAARNLGLDHAEGEFIGFVDSDDWIDPDMFETLLRRAETTCADIVECGVFLEYPNKTVSINRKNREMTGAEAVEALLNHELSEGVWNKLWKRGCFNSIRFPEGRIYEEIATTYRIFYDSNSVYSMSYPKYHYLQREGSLSRNRCIKNMLDYWHSHKERYEFLVNKVGENKKTELLRLCALAAARIWAHYCGFREDEIAPLKKDIQEISAFSNKHFPLFGESGWDLNLRIGVYFTHFNSIHSFRSAWLLNSIYKRITGLLSEDIRIYQFF